MKIDELADEFQRKSEEETDRLLAQMEEEDESYIDDYVEEYLARREQEDMKRKDKEDERDTWANPSGGISWGDDED